MIEYTIESLSAAPVGERFFITEAWRSILSHCRSRKLGDKARLALALQNIDVVTSWDLAYKLLLIRGPQLVNNFVKFGIDNDKKKIFSVRLKINQSSATCYSTKETGLSIYKGKHLKFKNNLRFYRKTSDGQATTSRLFLEISKEKSGLDGVRMALQAGLDINPLDSLLFFECRRLALEINTLRRKEKMTIKRGVVEVFDTHTNIKRLIPSYKLQKKAP